MFRIAGIAGIGELSVGKRGDLLCFDADLRLMSTDVDNCSGKSSVRLFIICFT